MATHRLIAGDNDPVRVFLTDRGRRVPLNGAEVTMHSRSVLGGITVEVPCVVVDPEGEIEFLPPAQWQSPGVFRTQWPIVWAKGTPAERRLTVPNGGDGDFWDTFEVGARL